MVNIAVITGASSGIGREFAIQIDRLGDCDELWLIARREEKLRETASLLTAPCRIFSADLENCSALDVIESALTAENPRVLFAVNAAGFGLNGDFAELDKYEQLQMVDLNCRSVTALTHLVTPFMPRGARFYNISSIAGAAPLGAFAVYGATKAYLTSFSAAVSAELESRGIGMTIVTPGSVDTEFQSRSRGKDGRKKKLFAKKSSAEDVVSQALSDGRKGKLFSRHGFQAKAAVFLAKILTPYQSARLAYTKIYPKK